MLTSTQDTAADSRDAPGWYGKLATLGDFAYRRLPSEFVQIGDAWLSRAMSASREQLGPGWLDVYLTAPVLRFAWAPGVVDGHWWFGVLMPSCDNVGRYFPLLIGQQRARPPLDRIALDHLELWFDHLAQAATHTLAEQASVEGFEEALRDAPPWPTPGAPAAMTQGPAPGGESFRLGRASSLNDWLHAMAIHALHERFAGCSLWWRQAGGGHEATVNVIHGLPDPMGFAQMLSGDVG